MPTFEESFCEAEEVALRFLVEDHGFRAIDRVVAEGLSQHGVHATVTYASGGALETSKVVLGLAPLRLELDMVISNSSGSAYSIEELHALDGEGPFPPREHGLYEAMHSSRELHAEFNRLARVLRAAGARFFARDPQLWADLAAQRDCRVQDEEDKRTLVQSESAFQCQDWHRVVQLLEPRTSRLGKAASARLAYARKQASSAT